MTESNSNPDKFASLSERGFYERLGIVFLDICTYAIIKAFGSATRLETGGIECLDALVSAGKFPILAYWHDRVVLGTYAFRARKILSMVSPSFDGDYLARVSQRFGYGVIRGSSTRGGSEGLSNMVQAMKTGRCAAMAVDGPRGPRYKAKIGAVILARRTGNPILPVSIEPRGRWTVNSWDKMQIPYPFTRAAVIAGEPIYVSADADETEISSKLAELQAALDRLVENGRLWRESH